MVRFLTFLAFAGISAAKLTGFHAYKRGYGSDALDPIGTPFNVADTCVSQLVCDKLYCMQQSGTCCGHGDGMYCATGTYCSGSGCCEDNTVCSDKVEGCQTGYDQCGAHACMPSGSVCCDDGSYCNKGDVCASDGTCKPGEGSSGASGAATSAAAATSEVGVTSEAAIPTGEGPTIVVSDSVDTYTNLLLDTSAPPEVTSATDAGGMVGGGDTMLGTETTATVNIDNFSDASATAEPTFETVTSGDGSSGDMTSTPEASSTETATDSGSAGSFVGPSIFGAILAAIAAL